MPSHALLSSSRQDWRTPSWFLGLVREVGPIALDPATSPDNPTRAERFYTRPDCGLREPWVRDGMAFVNPPYGPHLSGPIEPDYEHTRKCKTCGGAGSVGMPTVVMMPCGKCGGQGRVLTGLGRGWAARIAQDPGEWIALVPVRTETDWWRTLHSACSYALFWSSKEFGRRINFVHPDTGQAQMGSNLASTVFYHGQDPARFLEVFARHGRIIPGEKALIRLLGGL